MKNSSGLSISEKWLPNNSNGANMILPQGAACIQSFESMPQGCQVLSPFVQTCIFIMLESSKGFAAIHIDSASCVTSTLKKIIEELRNMGDPKITAKIVGGAKYYAPVLLLDSSSASLYSPAYDALKQEGVKYSHHDYCLIAGRLIIQLVVTACLAALAKDSSHWIIMLLLTVGAACFAIYDRFFNTPPNYMCKVTYSKENGLEFNTEHMKDIAHNDELAAAFEAKTQALMPHGIKLLWGKIILNTLPQFALTDFMAEGFQGDCAEYFNYLNLSEKDKESLSAIRKLLLSEKRYAEGKGIEFLRLHLPNKQAVNSKKREENTISIIKVN
jgi:hypothetical protein